MLLLLLGSYIIHSYTILEHASYLFFPGVSCDPFGFSLLFFLILLMVNTLTCVVGSYLCCFLNSHMRTFILCFCITTLNYPSNNVSLFAINHFVRNLWHSTWLHCLNSCRVLRVMRQRLWNGQKKVGASFVLPRWPARLFTSRCQDQVSWRGQ
jgi:hypothetical protein